MQDMDDIHHHQLSLRNEFGDLSPNLMVVFYGLYKPKVGEYVKADDIQVFHHLKCEILTGSAKPMPGEQKVAHCPANYCYKRGANLIQIQVARQFGLKMCRRCLDLFTKGQQDLWNQHSLDL
jgi:hypothetical protein